MSAISSKSKSSSSKSKSASQSTQVPIISTYSYSYIIIWAIKWPLIAGCVAITGQLTYSLFQWLLNERSFPLGPYFWTVALIHLLSLIASGALAVAVYTDHQFTHTATVYLVMVILSLMLYCYLKRHRTYLDVTDGNEYAFYSYCILNGLTISYDILLYLVGRFKNITH